MESRGSQLGIGGLSRLMGDIGSFSGLFWGAAALIGLGGVVTDEFDSYLKRNHADVTFTYRESLSPFSYSGPIVKKLILIKGQYAQIDYQLNDEDGLVEVGLYRDGKLVQMDDLRLKKKKRHVSSFLMTAKEVGDHVYSVRGIDKNNNDTEVVSGVLTVIDSK